VPARRASFRSRRAGVVGDKGLFTRPQVVGALLLGLLVFGVILLSRWAR
jgi:hypothetical protein